MRSAKAPEESTSPRDGSVRRARRRQAASSAVAASARSTGPIETSAPPTATSTLGRSRARRSERTTAARKTRNERSRAGTRGRLGIGRNYRYGLSEMQIAFLTGIWPPDVGGPATHGPDFARFLVARGHGVHVVTMGDGEPAERPCEVEVVSRRWPFPIRYGLVALKGARAARGRGRRLRDRDVCRRGRGLERRAAPTRREARLRPRVRAGAPLPALRRDARGVPATPARAPVRALKAARTRALRRAQAIVVPSAYLAAIAEGWGLRGERIRVLTNPAPPPRDIEPMALPRGTFVFVGRLTRQKALDVAIDAVARVPDARLVVVGDGPERGELERRAAAVDARPDRVSRHAVSRRGAGGGGRRDGGGAVERLGEPAALGGGGALGRRAGRRDGGGRRARGRPRRRERAARASPAGPTRSPQPSRRILEEPGLRERLAAGAKPSVAALSSDEVYGKLEARARRGEPVSGRLRALFVGRMRYTLPLPDWLAPKWDGDRAGARLPGHRRGRRGQRPERRTVPPLPAGAPARASTGSCSTFACPSACGKRSGSSSPTSSSRRIPSSAPPPCSAVRSRAGGRR